MLDPDEYLHLALHASSVGDRHACMSYLKEVLKQQPQNAVALYLLAAQHAELGLIERAIAGMQAALVVDPGLQTARFQLGLLLMDRHRAHEALEHFRVLGGSSNPALRRYAPAMASLVNGDATAAREQLAQGLAEDSGHGALSALMQRVLDRISVPSESAGSAPASQEGSGEVHLGAYRDASV